MGTPSILLEIANHKRKEVAARKDLAPLDSFLNKIQSSSREFKKALIKNGVSLIAEIKQASPSEGIIRSSDFDVNKIAETYELSGASAISVLTDKKYFGGDFNYLREVAETTKTTPILCKDFIVDEYQIYEARYYGADAVLLIAGILSIDQMESLLLVARKLKMNAICEVHNLEELKNVLETSADIIGINNRDLHTFKIDLNTTNRLITKIPKGKIIISESGIYSRDDVDSLNENIDAILVGACLMKAANVEEKITELINNKTHK